VNLLTFRLIGHPLFPDSSWLKAGRGVNILRAENSEYGTALLQMLQTINPPYNLEQINPFVDFPLHTFKQPHSRKIILSKKTVALAIFVASPQLVKELAALDPALYDTDRIELGRRRDYSRWINFIELSGSTRWSEIASTVSSLLPLVRPNTENVVVSLQAAMDTLRGSDRIKGEIATQIKVQLQKLRTILPEEYRSRLDPCFHAIDRSQHFIQAKKVVAARLPLFLYLSEATAESSTQGVGSDITPFSYLATRLREHSNDQASFEHSVQQVNLRLRMLHPELQLKFRVKEKSFSLECAKDSANLLLTKLAPVEKIEALMSGLALLHEALYSCDPIFILDINQLNLKTHERIGMVKMLRRYCIYRQCLVAPDSDFLAICVDVCRDSENNELSWMKLIDV
jgi:hypothetical protein